jgi:hypothetical protein
MDILQALQYQQLEFFLLYNLVVEELHILRRTSRMPPSSADTIQEGSVRLTRLFRSFLSKVFPSPAQVSKRPYRLEFTVSIDEPTKQLLQRARDSESCQTLRAPTTEEIGLLRFSFPGHLTLVLSGHRMMRRSRWYQNKWDASDLGIGKFCGAVKATLAWKARFDKAVSDARAVEAAPPEPAIILPPARNLAQEQLDAVLRAAAEAGRI